MNIKTVTFAAVAALVLVVGLVLYQQRTSGPVAVALQPGNADLVGQGLQVYADNCASCHGENLEGQPNWRQRNAEGRLPAPPHDPSGHTWHHSDQLLFDLTKFGLAAVSGKDYATDMPVYKDILSDQEIIAVLSFIKSTWPKEIRDRHDQLNQKN